MDIAQGRRKGEKDIDLVECVSNFVAAVLQWALVLLPRTSEGTCRFVRSVFALTQYA